MREAGCAFAWRSHVTKSCLSWDISDVTSCNAPTSRRVSLWRHVFTSRPPAIRHIHVKTGCVTVAKWLFMKNVPTTKVRCPSNQRCTMTEGCKPLYTAMCVLPRHLQRCRHGAKFKSSNCFCLTLFNPLKPELNPICYLLALLEAHNFLHVSRIRDKSLTLRRLISYIYGAPILDVSRSHTTTHHSR